MVKEIKYWCDLCSKEFEKEGGFTLNIFPKDRTNKKIGLHGSLDVCEKCMTEIKLRRLK